MATINIRRDVTDQFYRYKMPKLQAKIEGRGNGIKTLIINMSGIATSLARPAAYITKFFGFELGTQVKMDEQKDRYIVNGAHDAEKLATILDVFIDKFVLCAECKNPETVFIFEKNDLIKMDCKACGAKSEVDLRHKLVGYIQKHKPEQQKDHYKKAAAANDAATGDNSDAEEQQGQEPGLSQEDIDMLPVASQNDDDNDWSADLSQSAINQRMKDLQVSGAVSKLMDKEATADSGAMNEFADDLSKRWRSMSDDEIYELAIHHGIKEDKAITVVVQIVFNENILKENQIPKKVELLQKFMKNEKCQKGLIGGFERLAGVTHRELLPRIALVFKDLYFNDLVDEEVFLSWAEKLSKRYVEKKVAKELKDKATPFIQWLETAEEESD